MKSSDVLTEAHLAELVAHIYAQHDALFEEDDSVSYTFAMVTGLCEHATGGLSDSELADRFLAWGDRFSHGESPIN